MVEIAETALTSPYDRLPQRSPQEDLLPIRSLTEAPEPLMGRLDHSRASLTISLLQEQVVVERSEDAPSSPGESVGPSPGRYLRIVVLATDDQERKRFIDELAAHIVTQMTPQTTSTILEVGELRVDRDAHRVTVNGRDVALTAMEYKLLIALALHRDRVLDRPTLLRSAWASEVDGGPRRVDIAVRRLRVKLGSAARFVQTLRGFGYRFSDSSAA